MSCATVYLCTSNKQPIYLRLHALPFIAVQPALRYFHHVYTGTQFRPGQHTLRRIQTCPGSRAGPELDGNINTMSLSEENRVGLHEW